MAEAQGERQALSGLTHRCAIRACLFDIPIEYMMCRPHWAQVPEALRMEVWARWRRMNRLRNEETSTAYRNARQQAIASVEGSQG